MSGGYFDGRECHMLSIVDDIRNYIEKNKHKMQLEILEKFSDTIDYLEKSHRMVKEIDYLIEGDTSEDSFLTRWKDKIGH